MKLRHYQFWSTDSEERWNLTKTRYIDKLLESEWNENSVIDYNFDSNGFRNDTDEIPKDSILVLGCSFAEGVGLRKEQTFGALLADKIGIPHLNYAKGGSGPLGAFYIAEKFIKEIKPKYICYLRSQLTRIDIYDPNEEGLSFQHDAIASVSKSIKIPYLKSNRNFFDHHWLALENFRSKVNDCVELAITKIANDNNAKLLIVDSSGPYEQNTEYEESLLAKTYVKARDLMHEGAYKHEFWASKFLQELNNE